MQLYYRIDKAGLYMNSIIKFLENDLIDIEKYVVRLAAGQFKIDDFIAKVQAKLQDLLKSITAEAIESIDGVINEVSDRYIIEHSGLTKTIVTPVGEITYKRNYYRDRITKDHFYLADEILGVGKHERMTPAAIAQVLEEAIDTSYRRGGIQLIDSVSKQTVKNIVHNVEIPEEPAGQFKTSRKKVRNLYVIADEDHVSLQFNRKKGDLKTDGRYKCNTVITKLACVYEGIRELSGETSKSKRYALYGKHYFSGVYPGTDNNEKFWNEIANYIYNEYDVDYLENVFLSSDGGKWIQAGAEFLPKCKFVLDSFHITKYIHQAVNQLRLSSDDAERELYIAIRNNDRKAFVNTINDILYHLEEDGNPEPVMDCKKYILNNWKGITNKSEYRELLHGCSAEGQVSHILSARMSSRPMGWTVKGAHQMAKLRAYKANGGKVIDLLAYKSEKEIKERKIDRIDEVVKTLRLKQKENKYYDRINASIPGLESSKMRVIREIIDSISA